MRFRIENFDKYLLQSSSFQFAQQKRSGSFRVPGGTPGLIVTCGIGLLGAVFAIFLGFFPPSQLAKAGIDSSAFIIFLGVGLSLGILIPLGIGWMRRLN